MRNNPASWGLMAEMPQPRISDSALTRLQGGGIPAATKQCAVMRVVEEARDATHICGDVI